MNRRLQRLNLLHMELKKQEVYLIGLLEKVNVLMN
jgi:hypothetical protein